MSRSKGNYCLNSVCPVVCRSGEEVFWCGICRLYADHARVLVGLMLTDTPSMSCLSDWNKFLYFWHTYLDRNLQNSSPSTNPLLIADSSAVASVFNTRHVSTFQVLLQDEQCSASCAAEDDPGRHQEQGRVWRDRSRPHKQTPGRKTIGALMTSSTETPPPPSPGRTKGEERTPSVLFLFACLTALGYSKSKALDLVLQTAIYGLLDWKSKLFLECILKMFKLHFLLNAVPLHHWPNKCTSKIPSLKHWCMADWDFSDSSLFFFCIH